jgi:hydrogenase maturation protease
MNREAADRVANAVLYEGHILYPYRPSVKNRQRWTFGGLYPEAHCQAQGGSDAADNRTECLVRGGPDTTFAAVVRFLHVTARTVGAIDPPLAEWPDDTVPSFRPVEVLRVGDTLFYTWQEAEEREVALGGITLAELSARPHRRDFTFLGGRRLEPLRGSEREVHGVLVREQHTIHGAAEVMATVAAPGVYRVTLTVANRTPLPDAARKSRDELVLRTLVSTHLILGVRGSEFVSLLDPPEDCREAAAACRNRGTWPVLVGAEGQHDTMLSSPIILYDYPRVSPESPGDFFDATEIDEMLTLRILTLTDEEKRAMAGVDEVAAALLARTEGMARGQLRGLHGTLRDLRPATEEGGRE